MISIWMIPPFAFILMMVGFAVGQHIGTKDKTIYIHDSHYMKLRSHLHAQIAMFEKDRESFLSRKAFTMTTFLDGKMKAYRTVLSYMNSKDPKIWPKG